MKFSWQQIIVVAIGLALICLTPVQAKLGISVITQQPQLNTSSQLNEPLVFNAPPPPDDIGEPGDRTAGGKRGCQLEKQLTPSKEKRLTALVPVYPTQFVWGLTTAAHPTLWFYIPYKYQPELSGELVLQEAGETIYQTAIALPFVPGVVSFSLPPTSKPLSTGKRYHWYFSIYCNPQKPPVASVDGFIERRSFTQELSLKGQLDKVTPRQRIALYANNGIWYEALTTLAIARRTSPQDGTLATDWANLLQSVGLDHIAPEPMIDCCKADN